MPCTSIRSLESRVVHEGELRLGLVLGLLAQRTAGGVARIGEDPIAGRSLGGVELAEQLDREVHLAAHLDDVGVVGAGRAARG